MSIAVESKATAIINAPIEQIDLTTWLFTLKDHEYQSCSHAHIAGGGSLTNDGRRISINVERVADNLLVQHYHEEVSGRNHCRVRSRSDSISPLGISKLEITWELTVRQVSVATCELTNRVLVELTDEFRALLASAGISDFEKVKAQMVQNVRIHNEDETPQFAKDIEGKARAAIWI